MSKLVEHCHRLPSEVGNRAHDGDASLLRRVRQGGEGLRASPCGIVHASAGCLHRASTASISGSGHPPRAAWCLKSKGSTVTVTERDEVPLPSTSKHGESVCGLLADELGMTESAIARIWANAERPDKRSRTRSESVLSGIPCRTGWGGGSRWPASERDFPRTSAIGAPSI